MTAVNNDQTLDISQIMTPLPSHPQAEHTHTHTRPFHLPFPPLPLPESVRDSLITLIHKSISTWPRMPTVNYGD